jgi:PAS domain S-box-containing protein
MAATMGTIPTGLQLETLLDDLGLIAYSLDARGQITWVSDIVARLFGYTADELIGQDALMLVAPEDREIVRTQILRKLRGEAEVTAYEVKGLTKDGRRVVVRMVSCAVRGDGRVTGVKGLACTHPPVQKPPASVHLTPRQRETLALLGAGLTTGEVAGELGVSHETARNHIRAVLQALDSHTRLEAVSNARQLGLI